MFKYIFYSLAILAPIFCSESKDSGDDESSEIFEFQKEIIHSVVPFATRVAWCEEIITCDVNPYFYSFLKPLDDEDLLSGIGLYSKRYKESIENSEEIVEGWIQLLEGQKHSILDGREVKEYSFTIHEQSDSSLICQGVYSLKKGEEKEPDGEGPTGTVVETEEEINTEEEGESEEKLDHYVNIIRVECLDEWEHVCMLRCLVPGVDYKSFQEEELLNILEGFQLINFKLEKAEEKDDENN